MKTKVSVGVSNRHVHLTEELYNKLFSDEMTKRKDLNQIGEFVSNSVVSIKTNKYRFDNVRVLGPFRNYNQVEVSRTDARRLGLNPPVANSGELTNAETITIFTDKASIDIKACIIAERHVHMNFEDAKKYGVCEYQPIKLIVEGNKGGTLNGVVKITENGFFEAHIDTDEAAAFGLEQNAEITLEI